MRLSRLLGKAASKACRDLDITSIVSDTREACEGAMFVARRGERVDSHELVMEAYERGARAFLVEREVSLPRDAVIIYAEDSTKAASELLLSLYGHPERRMKLIGITGTKGKSTVAAMLSEALSKNGISNIAVGTLGVIGMEYPRRSENTTPDAFYLYPLLSCAAKRGIRAVILEVSSQALKKKRLWGLKFDCVALTSLGIDHIGEGEHEDFFDYLSSKRRLFSDFGAPIAVVNGDCSFAKFMAGSVGKCIHCSLEGRGEVFAESIFTDEYGTRFFFRGDEHRLYMCGSFNVMNALISSAICSEVFSIPMREAMRSLATVRVEGRFETVMKNERRFIIDYAHNGMSIKAICEAARAITEGRIIAVVGSVGERSRERRADIGRAAERYADFTVITEDNPNWEPSISVCADIYSAFRDKNRGKIITDRREAIKYANSVARAGDTILLLGKGHEKFQKIRGKAIPFSEKEVVYSLDSES